MNSQEVWRTGPSSTGAQVTAVEIVPCDSEPCALRRGVNYVTRVTFTARSTGAQVTAVEIVPCDSEPCALRRGVNYIARVAFTANVNVGVGGFTVEGTVGSRPMTVPLPPNGLCVYLLPRCPIEVGGNYVYRYTGAVPLEFPADVYRPPTVLKPYSELLVPGTQEMQPAAPAASSTLFNVVS
ncbi:Niemann-Pick disease type C2 [Clonorchis sinensis]|uniref:Niemann-Pick disease type C2 n=1 Tax=Clonorchis sinensis TaxID=79923 RepID=G7YUB4_CLOSI|nr:Niemann-Pick disease type C2 [Clonorchis sinensis]